MSWQDILKNKTSIDDLISEVDEGLEEFLNSELLISGGDWEEELEGYRDASKFSLYINYPNGEIEISPSDTHEDDDDIKNWVLYRYGGTIYCFPRLGRKR